MTKPRFKVVPIRGKNAVASNKRVHLRAGDFVCWLNPTPKPWPIRFGKSPISGRGFTVKAGKPSRWYTMKKLPKGTLYPYRIGPDGGPPGGPAIISDGG